MLDKDVEVGIIFHAASLNPDIGMRGNQKSGRISREIHGNRVLFKPKPVS
jgi:hypothetical protein